MYRFVSHRSRITLLICCVILSVTAVGVFLTAKTASQKRSVNIVKENDLVAKIERYPSAELRKLENSDTPLNIIEANSKEISAEEFTALTGVATKLAKVSSFPETTLKNSSTKTISSFMLVVRDPVERSMRSQTFRNIAITPGENFTVTSQRFITPEKFTYTDNKGVTVTGEKSRLESINNWIQFGERSNLFVTVGMVTFDDGTQWVLKEEGEIR